MEMFVGSVGILADKKAPTYKWQYETIISCCEEDGFVMQTEKHLSDFEKNKKSIQMLYNRAKGIICLKLGIQYFHN